jgi:hypothetical protein
MIELFMKGAEMGSFHQNDDEHKINLDDLYKRLNATSDGLFSGEVAKRQHAYGFNVLEEKEKQPIIIRFGKHLVNFFALLLWTGAALAFTSEYLSPGEGNLYIGIALAGVVLLNAVFTFIQEYQSEQIMESFRKMMPVKIEVLRDGKRMEVLSKEIVPGDIIYLDEGDKIPADGRLIEENSLKVDHSALTGESEPQLRKLVPTHENILESRNMVFYSCSVRQWGGYCLRHRHEHAAWQDCSAYETDRGGAEPTQKGAEPLHHDHICNSNHAWPFLFRLQFFDLKQTYGKHDIRYRNHRGKRARGASSYSDPVSEHGLQKDGEKNGTHKKSGLSGNARLYDGHMHRQDRYDYGEQDVRQYGIH